MGRVTALQVWRLEPTPARNSWAAVAVTSYPSIWEEKTGHSHGKLTVLVIWTHRVPSLGRGMTSIEIKWRMTKVDIQHQVLGCTGSHMDTLWTCTHITYMPKEWYWVSMRCWMRCRLPILPLPCTKCSPEQVLTGDKAPMGTNRTCSWSNLRAIWRVLNPVIWITEEGGPGVRSWESFKNPISVKWKTPAWIWGLEETVEVHSTTVFKENFTKASRGPLKGCGADFVKSRPNEV